MILSEGIHHLMVMLVEGVHVLLELEIHWALVDSALVILKQMLILLELSLARLLYMRRKLRNYGQCSVDSWQFVWIHILQKWTFLCSVDFGFFTILR